MNHPFPLDSFVTGTLMLALFGVLALGLLVAVFYLLSMRKALTLAGREHRELDPEMVWLMFIPLFGLVWQFFIVKHVSGAVQRWGAAHGKDMGDGGWTIGLVACILACCSIVPLVNVLASPASLVCLIIWWIKVAGFNTTMGSEPSQGLTPPMPPTLD